MSTSKEGSPFQVFELLKYGCRDKEIAAVMASLLSVGSFAKLNQDLTEE